MTITNCDSAATGALEIPASIEGFPVTWIGDGAFSDCTSLTSLTIPASMTAFYDGAFSGCSSLTTIEVADYHSTFASVDGVLFSKDLSTLLVFPADKAGTYTIPAHVTVVNPFVFRGCSRLTAIWVAEAHRTLASVDGILFSKDLTTLLICPAGKIVANSIPDSVASIGEGAFRYGNSLLSMTIPAGVTGISPSEFYHCSRLTSIAVAVGNDSYASVDGILFSKNLTTLLICPAGKIGANLIPSSVASIGDDAFYSCQSLTSVTIPGSVTRIGEGAFSRCSSLVVVTILEGVTSIDGGAFSRCSSLTSVTIPESVTGIGSSAFSGCSSLTSVTIPDSVTSLGGSAFRDCSSLASVTMSEGVTEIADYSFSGCSSLTSVTLLAGVESIGPAAFYGCTSLTSITIPGSVTSFADAAFEGCTSLTSIMIPEGVTSIGWGAFRYCSSLTTIGVADGQSTFASVDGILFSQDLVTLLICPAGKIVANSIPDSVASIGDYAFYSCQSLTSVTIPSSVTRIGEGAFLNCSSLVSIHFDGSIAPEIDHIVFAGVSDQAVVTYPTGATGYGDSFGGLPAIAVTSLWAPEGWVYVSWPYAYSLDEVRWHFFDRSDTQWRVNLTDNEWETLSAATGWNYFAWPYAYSIDASTWHWYDLNSEQWVVDLTSGVWSLLGHF